MINQKSMFSCYFLHHLLLYPLSLLASPSPMYLPRLIINSRFMGSEVDLDEEIKKMHIIATAPSLYPVTKTKNKSKKERDKTRSIL